MQQVRPQEYLLAWHKRGFREEGLPIKREIDKIDLFLNVLSATEGHMDVADEPRVDSRTQVVWQFELPIEAGVNNRGPELPRYREEELGHAVIRHRPRQHRWEPFRR